MLLDERTEFADAAALSTADTGLALVGDQIDLGLAGRNPGVGEPVWLVIEVDTAVTSNGDATVSFLLASDAQAAIAVDGSASEHLATPAIPKASLVAGYKVAFALPQGIEYERYLGLLQNVGVAALTAGKINAFLVSDVDQWKAYARGN
jgi:hypothetical protein